MNEEMDTQRKKPDGSAYDAHLAAIAARNVASKKAGKARRDDYEREKVKDRREAERRQDAALRGQP